ncbi:MAG: response regulator transcription factor [Acidimicrobiales bacterium]
MTWDAAACILVAMAATSIRLLVVDDHPVVRDGVRSAMAGREGIEVVGEAGSGREAVEIAARVVPDVVLMDLHMPGGGGVEAIREVRRVCEGARCLVLTMDEDDESLFGAMRAGACGYLLKGARGDDIERGVRAAAAGEMVFASGLDERVRSLFDHAAPTRGASAFPMLSDRELTLLSLLAKGLDNASIGRRLGLAPKTVRNQVSLLLTRIGVTDRAAAVAAARDAGLGGKDGAA